MICASPGWLPINTKGLIRGYIKKSLTGSWYHRWKFESWRFYLPIWHSILSLYSFHCELGYWISNLYIFFAVNTTYLNLLGNLREVK